ncbi:MAG: zf-HC2 domain-containing protein [Clostridiales bacterium]|nr:zf-HC2 domain-containing protein [Clostridiales bacterium]
MEHDIIFDLLPLYHDGVCSAASRAAVEAHLKACGTCREALLEMDAPLPAAEEQKNAADGAVVKGISEAWKKEKWKARLKGAAIAAAVCLLLVGAWLAATQLFIFPVDPATIEITDVRQLADGRILYHFYIDDDLNLRRTEFQYDEDGNMYCVPIRALITEKRWEGNSPANMELFLDMEWVDEQARFMGFGEIDHVWYGRGEDAILLWEEGMDLPAAGEADEAAYGYSESSADYWAERK